MAPKKNQSTRSLMEPPPVPTTEDAADPPKKPPKAAATVQDVAPPPAEAVAASPLDSSLGTPQGKTSRVETTMASSSTVSSAEEEDSSRVEDGEEAPVEAPFPVEAPASTAPLPATASDPPAQDPPQAPTPPSGPPGASALLPVPVAPSAAQPIDPWATALLETPGRGEHGGVPGGQPFDPRAPAPHPPIPRATQAAPPAAYHVFNAYEGQAYGGQGYGGQAPSQFTSHAAGYEGRAHGDGGAPPTQRPHPTPAAPFAAYGGEAHGAYDGGAEARSFATRMHMGHARAPTLVPNRVPGALQRGGYLWGVPREAVEYQHVGGWAVRKGYLTSLIMESAPANASGTILPSHRWSSASEQRYSRGGGGGGGGGGDHMDEVARKLAHLSYQRYMIPPAPPAPSPAPEPEPALKESFDAHFRQQATKGKGGGGEKARGWYAERAAAGRAGELEAAAREGQWVASTLSAPRLSLVPHAYARVVPLDRLIVERLDELERLCRWTAREGPRASQREEQWVASTLSAPRLSLVPPAYVRVVPLDRAGEYGLIVERLDELERLVRFSPMEARALRRAAVQQRPELLVLHRAYPPPFQDGVFVLRCRELLEDYLPADFGGHRCFAGEFELELDAPLQPGPQRYRGVAR